MSKLHNLNVRYCVAAMLMLLATGMLAQSSMTLKSYSWGDATTLTTMSDNGNWALACSQNQESDTPMRLVNLQNGTNTVIVSTAQQTVQEYTAKAVTDDGNIVVGSVGMQPAYWNKSTGEWTKLPLPAGQKGGNLLDVTADGKYAIGRVFVEEPDNLYNVWSWSGCMWDLTTNKIVALQNVPVKNKAGNKCQQSTFKHITNDGRYIIIEMDFSYTDETTFYIYDREKGTYRYIGYDESDRPLLNGMAGIALTDLHVMSPDGRYLIGLVEVVNGNTSTGGVFRYDMQTNAFEVYNKDDFDQDMYPAAVDNNGTIYGATPTGTPLRDWYVRSGNYWYPVEQILRKAYNYDFFKRTQYEWTGTPMAVSGDGKKIIVMCDPQYGGGYFLQVPDELGSLCDNLNILTDYEVSVPEGSSFSKIKSIDFTFTRDIEYIGNYKDIKLVGTSGHTITSSSSGNKIDPTNSRILKIGFFPTALHEGEEYTLYVPAGSICVSGDRTKTNDDIQVKYYGRADKPVTYTSIYPANGSEVTKIDYDGSPIIISFSSSVKLSQNASAKLELVEDGNVSLVCSLNLATDGKGVAVYPSTKQNLFLGYKYRVTVEAGSVTDVQNNNPNEAIVLEYTGIYERDISSDASVIFEADMNDVAVTMSKFLLYEGDHNTPTEAMQAMQYNADDTPWNFTIRESEESEDLCAASHSMYTPAGKSDDWMMTPQLYIPDGLCKLTFDAQSYKKNKTDKLKVVVWESGSNINVLTNTVMQRVKSEAKEVLNVTLSPGSDEEGLSGDWQTFVVDLAAYAGKDIHIGFVNENQNQSMVFVDNILVSRDMNFTVSLNNEDIVVQKENIPISGSVTVKADNVSYSSVKLTLKDAQGNKIDEIAETGLTLSKNKKYNFSFSKPLPLTIGVVNNFAIDVALDGDADVVKSRIKNLAFKPVKNVVLEEITGTTCPNCPRGILAIEKIRERFGSQFIPVSIHTYTGDAFGSGLTGYSNSLGLNAAPSAIINRSSDISSPIGKDYVTFKNTFSNGYNLWMDYVAAEMEIPAEGDISAKVIEGGSDDLYALELTTRYAMTANNLNLNVFIVLLEDGLVAYQYNNLGTETDPIFGKWGQGGIYSAGTVQGIVHDDVVRAYYGSVSGSSLALQSMVAGQEYKTTTSNLTIPSSVENKKNAKFVVMLLDANTGKVINATCVKLDGSSDVKNICDNDKHIGISARNGSVHVVADGQATVRLYSASGMLIGEATGNGSVKLDANGYHGTAIVKVNSGNRSVVKKIVL